MGSCAYLMVSSAPDRSDDDAHRLLALMDVVNQLLKDPFVIFFISKAHYTTDCWQYSRGAIRQNKEAMM